MNKLLMHAFDDKFITMQYLLNSTIDKYGNSEQQGYGRNGNNDDDGNCSYREFIYHCGFFRRFGGQNCIFC